MENVQVDHTLNPLERRLLLGSLTRRSLISAGTAVLLLSSDVVAETPTPITRTVETDHGPVMVPGRAERVVCADFFGAFAVVDLGLVPVGAGGSGFSGVGEPYATLLADVPSVGDFLEPDLEAILEAEPDLILRTIDTDDEMYKRLSAIAPTVVLSFQQLDLISVANRIGEVLGREQEARELLEAYRDSPQRSQPRLLSHSVITPLAISPRPRNRRSGPWDLHGQIRPC